jgi:S1-C subfamily serine protease
MLSILLAATLAQANVAALTASDVMLDIDYAVEGLPAGGFGSGVVIAIGPEKSLVLTAAHVTRRPEAATDYTMKLTGRLGSCQGRAIKVGANVDLAIVEADCVLGRPVQLGGLPQVGDPVFLVGHPAGAPLPVITQGYYSGLDDGLMLVSAGAYPGNSGGGAYSGGKLVGILVRGAPAYHHLSLCLPAAVIREFLTN